MNKNISVDYCVECNAANRVESVNEEGWTHDENGNVTERAYGGQTWTLTYDAEDRVVRIEEKGESLGVNIAYDGLGRKVWQEDEIAETETTFIYSGSTLVAEVRDGQLIPIGYGLGMAERAGAYQHWSVRGDLTATSNGSGTYSTAPVFDAYGASVSGARADYDFGGAWLYRNVSNTGGLTHIGARWYDPETGRWLQKDPAVDGWNLYRYCANDPANGIDVTGMWYVRLGVTVNISFFAVHATAEIGLVVGTDPNTGRVGFGGYGTIGGGGGFGLSAGGGVSVGGSPFGDLSTLPGELKVVGGSIPFGGVNLGLPNRCGLLDPWGPWDAEVNIGPGFGLPYESHLDITHTGLWRWY